MDLARGFALLERLGEDARFVVQPIDGRSARIAVGERSWEARVRALDTPPGPARVAQDVAALDPFQGLIYVVPRLTPSLRAAALADRRLVVAAVDEGVAVIDGREWTASAGELSTSAPRGRKPWGRSAVARVLLRSGAPRTQTQIATEAGITQQAVAAAVKSLGSLGVLRARGGWVADEPGPLWDAFMLHYPGPGGLRRWWSGVAELGEQADRARSLDPRALLSGDAAADRQAPLRRPVTVTLYAEADIDLSARFSTAAGEASTLSVVVPDDPTIFATARAWAEGDPEVTDPVLTAWEVARSRGADRADAVEHLRRSVLQSWSTR